MFIYENLTIKKIGEIQNVSEKFKKREFVAISGGDYPQEIKFELMQNNTDKIESFSEGEAVNVSFDVRGRCWVNPKDNKENYFVSLNAYKIENSI